MRIIFYVNNGRKLEVFQAREDGSVYVITYDSKWEKEGSTEIISPGDFITMLNWYRYQKSNGDGNLTF